MAEKKAKNYSNIISIDPITLNSYEYSKNEIRVNKLEKSKKDSFFTSYIPAKDIITASIDMSRSITDEDLKDAIEIKVYDELGLDSAVNYSITYLEAETNDTKNRFFNVFIIDANLVEERLSPIKKHTKYIDYVTGAPFLLQSLYRKNFIEPDSVDCFIYFQKEDAFLAIYRDGEYVYSKSLHYSLTQINEKFCELLGERIDEKDFNNLLTNEGLKGSNLDYQQHLMKLFGEIFLYINDVLIYAKRSYSLDSIDKIYIGSEIGELLGLDEYAQSYLGLEAHEFNFSIAINSKEWYIDQIHILMILSVQVYFDERDDNLNFSPFKRPPPLSKRTSGKLLGTIAASIIIALAYPSYQLGFDYFLQIKLSSQRKVFIKLNKKTTAIKRELANIKQQENKVKALVKKESVKFEFRKKLLDEIYAKKISYPMKALMMTELFKISNKYNSKIISADFKDNVLVFDIENRSDKKITEFIQNLTKLDKYKINTDKIVKDEKKKRYLSKISIGIDNEK
jgi:Tfp pilus assembly PilM family ATPase